MLTLKSYSLPAELQRLAVPPLQIYTEGDLATLLNRPRLAIVGSRKASPYGRAVTAKLTEGLTRAGVVIISGLALGIDSIAHRSCLEASGQTIAVLPSDLSHIYPSSHAWLADEITNRGGALVSEYPEGSTPYKQNFIARNRLIAGLAEGVLITEAAEKSGSLHTAHFALEQGKTVMSVPGNITSELSQGCNNLIKAGATPVTSVEDVMAAMGWTTVAPQLELLADNEEEHLILGLIRGGYSDGAQLLSQSGLETAQFNQTLTMLELTGRIRALGANHWAIT